MKLKGYFIEIDKALSTINQEEFKTIGLQIPEGLKSEVIEIVEYIEKKTKSTVLICTDPCYGACDIANYELKNLGVDFIIQIGHTKIPEIDNILIPTAFINALSTRNVFSVIKKSIPFLEGNTIGIVTTAQHLHILYTVEEILKEKNFKPVISKGDKRISENGQVLGCNFSAGLRISKKVDSFLFIGSGQFHPVGLLISTKKPVIAADPYTNEVKKKELEVLKDLILRQRYGAIAKSKNAIRFGILIGMKRGQQRLKTAYKIKKTLDSFNKKSLFIVMDNFSQLNLQGFKGIDCFVSTSCPRIAIDDYLKYKLPILTPIELEILFDIRKWEDFTFDQITEIK